MNEALAPETHDLALSLPELAKMPILLGSFTDRFKAHLRTKPSDDEFSITEHICHLRDLEIEGYLLRIQKILNEDYPLLPDFEGARIALERDYNSQDAIDALRSFAAARHECVRVLSSLTGEQLKRSGNLSGVGGVNITDLAQLIVRHDREHAEELEKLAIQNLIDRS